MLLDLPSSAAEPDIADNTINCFCVRLPRKLVLEPDDWEVEAMVTHIPKKFYKIVAGEKALLSHTSKVKQTNRVTIGFYQTPDSLLV